MIHVPAGGNAIQAWICDQYKSLSVQGKWHAELSRASTVPDPSEASWEQIGMVFRVVYAIGKLL